MNVNSFQEKRGFISIWGDYLGKPGDRIILLKSISIDQNSRVIQIQFEKEQIKIFDFETFEIDELLFRIEGATKISKIDSHGEIIFFPEGRQNPAFTFETW